MADIIDRFIEDLRAANGDPTQAEARFRQREGGLDGGYIRKTLRGTGRDSREARAAHNAQACGAIGGALASGQSLGEAFAAAGVSRSAGYRHLKRRASTSAKR